ncbi:hypothetical protein CGCF413_v011264 [Colletotrichum fructicola]|nr:hypothetical protein CGCF413_v011264 [Colletotrichum fructicola]
MKTGRWVCFLCRQLLARSLDTGNRPLRHDPGPPPPLPPPPPPTSSSTLLGLVVVPSVSHVPQMEPKLRLFPFGIIVSPPFPTINPKTINDYDLGNHNKDINYNTDSED